MEDTNELRFELEDGYGRTVPSRIDVDTAFGKLFAEVSGNPDYPGIVICVERDGEDGRYDHQLALAECTPDHPNNGDHALRLMIWGNDDIDDYTTAHTFYTEFAADPPEVIWAKYLQYLREWADSHAGPGFMGCCPVCFDEWRSCEYAQEMNGMADD